MTEGKNCKSGIKCCPIETVFTFIGRKWAINIIRDLFMGKKRFSDFLEANSNLSTRILSLRLMELEQNGIIKKMIVSKTPLKAEYRLTNRGNDLNKVLYEMAMYSFRNFEKKVFFKQSKMDIESCEKITRKIFLIK